MAFLGGIFSKSKKETLNKGLEKTQETMFSKLSRAVAGKSTVDDDVLDDLEEVLITSDVGVDTTVKIIERIEKRVSEDKYFGASELNKILKEEIAGLLEENNSGTATEIQIPKDKKLIQDLEPTFQEIEKLNDELKPFYKEQLKLKRAFDKNPTKELSKLIDINNTAIQNLVASGGKQGKKAV